MPSHPLCTRPDDVYFDGKPLRHVASRSHLTRRSFYFAYRTHRIYLGRNPGHHLVEAAVCRTALSSTGVGGALVRGLVVEDSRETPLRATIGP